MPKFPTKEPDIIKLVDQMYAGYATHGPDFPNVHWTGLGMKRTTYKNALKAQNNAFAQVQIATEAKNESLNVLKEVMINCLRKAEVDTASSPEKLSEIGWGERTTPQAAQLPNQPTDLQLVSEDKTVKLQWVRPNDNQPVRNYVIERRQSISDWSILQIAYDTQITLRNQPMGIQLEYRIRAANIAGTGPFSNTVSVIL
jgi:hypothetical protein